MATAAPARASRWAVLRRQITITAATPASMTTVGRALKAAPASAALSTAQPARAAPATSGASRASSRVQGRAWSAATVVSASVTATRRWPAG